MIHGDASGLYPHRDGGRDRKGWLRPRGAEKFGGEDGRW